MKTKSLLIEFARYSFLFLFLYTGYSKLADHANFLAVLSVSPLLNPTLATFFSWVLPLSEIMIGLLLLVPAHTRLSLYLSFVLMLIFTLYLIYMVSTGERLPCHCGGVISQMSWKQHIFFNLFFCLIAGAAIVALNRNKHPDPPVFILDNYHR
jgi:uncharacterized membrane protein YphA (DoxX/SURF4 family)